MSLFKGVIMNIATQIKNYRKVQNWSQDDLAEKVFVSRQTISNWETEKSYPDLHSLFLLSNLFNITLDELVKGDLEKMKNELSNKKMNQYSIGMLVTMILMFLSLSLLKRIGFYATLPFFIVFALGMFYCAYQLEVLKKKLNIQTYQEIVDYMDGKDVNRDIQKQRKKRLMFENVLKVLGGLIVGLLMAFIALSF